MNYERPSCPECGRECEPAGEITMDTGRFVLFECPVCTVQEELFDEMIEVPRRVFRPADSPANEN